MDIEQEITAIKERNARVEAEKAWEGSVVRKVAIIVTTYILACILMWAIGVQRPYVDALVPTMGFFLSTLSMGFIRKTWIAKYRASTRS